MFHGFMSGGLVLLIHLVEFVDEAHAATDQDEGSCHSREKARREANRYKKKARGAKNQKSAYTRIARAYIIASLNAIEMKKKLQLHYCTSFYCADGSFLC